MEILNTSAIAIFIAMVLDGLDGRVARLTGTQSEFGAEYDSMSDMVSFGVAPALIAYEWALKDMGQWGWISCIYLLCLRCSCGLRASIPI
jgi:CDP-diacylglycerol--serine O-phosphatidyltransferase